MEEDRDQMEGLLLQMAEDAISSVAPFWAEHKKQSVLKYVRRWVRDLTLSELITKTNPVEHPKTFSVIGNLVIEAGAGYDRYIERQEKRR